MKPLAPRDPLGRLGEFALFGYPATPPRAEQLSLTAAPGTLRRLVQSAGLGPLLIIVVLDEAAGAQWC